MTALPQPSQTSFDRDQMVHAASVLPRTTAYRYDVLPVRFESAVLSVALPNDDPEIIVKLEAEVRFSVQIAAILDRRSIRDYLKDLYPIDPERVTSTEETGRRILDDIVAQAVHQHAMDITIEPFGDEGDGRVRLNVDGIHHTHRILTQTQYTRLVGVIRNVGNVSPQNQNIPGDGRLLLEAEGRQVELRVATIEEHRGNQVITARVLQSSKHIQALEYLGMPPDLADLYRTTLNRRGSATAIAGRTGAGKTTTVHAGLLELPEELKIMTVENPVETGLPNVIQIDAFDTGDPNEVITVESANRALVRHNPDVIFFGEIRSEETLRGAEREATKGTTLIFTVHARDAIRVIDRLVQFGANRPTLASYLNLLISQRLLRRVCPNCRISAVPSDQAKKIAEVFDIPLKTIYSARPGGCDLCNKTGYNGQIAAYEMFNINPDVATAISEEKFTNQLLEIAATAQEFPFRPMVLQALRHAGNGITTEAEVTRQFDYHDLDWMLHNRILNPRSINWKQ